MWGGDGAYVPSSSSAVDMTLRLHETVRVSNMGLTAHAARTVLDTGEPQTGYMLTLPPCEDWWEAC